MTMATSTSSIEMLSCVEGTNDNRQIQIIRDEIGTLHRIHREKWKCVIPMDPSDYSIDDLANLDALEFAGKGSPLGHNPPKFFCPVKFPTSGGFKGIGFRNLVKTFIQKAKENGVNIIQKGFYKYRGTEMSQITCSRSESYRGNTSERAESTYRNFSFHNDKKNSRGRQGKRESRRTRTSHALVNQNRCEFRILINIDTNNGFFVVPGRGNVYHTNHPRCGCNSFKMSTKFLSQRNIDLIKDMHASQSSTSNISNIINVRSGINLSNAKILYHRSLLDILTTDLVADADDCDTIIDWFTKKKYDYILLYHDSSLKSVCSDHVQVATDTQENFTINYPPEEASSAHEDAVQGRKSLGISEKQRYLMAFAWVIPHEAHLFRLFPETITVDVVKSTNNQKRPLFTMCGKTTHGKMFTIMRVYLPHEKTWIYRWLFCVAFPRLFGIPTIKMVKAVISDGDSQEIQQLDNAISLFLPHVHRIRCGWHLVYMGWRAHVPALGIQQTSQRKSYQEIQAVLKNWMYSWMKPSCETKSEYLLSKKLFLMYIYTHCQRESGMVFTNPLLLWFRNSLEPHEGSYCFWCRKFVRHYAEYTNSIHEGTNNSLKHRDGAVLPSLNLQTSVKKLSFFADVDNERRKCKATYEYLTESSNTNIAISKWLTITADNILQGLLETKTKYESFRILSNVWLCGRDPKYPKPKSNCKYPMFKRVRRLEYKHGRLHCSCPF